MFEDIFTTKKKNKPIYDNPFDFKLNQKGNNIIKREPVARSQKNEVLAQQRNRCARCKNILDMRATHFDHIKEVYKGGRSIVSNLQALCANCHNIKTHKDKLKQTEKKKTQGRKNNNSLLGSSLFDVPTKKRKTSGPFDMGF
jgi:hypothetical protein